MNTAAQPADIFFRSFSVAYYFAKIFGAMPFKIDKSKAPTMKNRWCRFGVISSFIYIVLVFFSMLLTKELSGYVKFKGKKLLSIHDKTQMIIAPMFVWSMFVSQIFTVVSYIMLPIYLKELNSIFRKFRKIADSPEGVLLFGDGEIGEKMVKTVRRNTCTIIIFYTILAISSAISSFNRIRLSSLMLFVVMVDTIIKKIEALSICTGFCSICDILLHCFYSINDTLTAMKFRRRESSNYIAYPLLNEMLPSTEHLLRSLNLCHTNLCDIIEHVNQIYQMQNLLGITICLLRIIPHLFLTGNVLTYSNFTIIHSSFFLWPAQYFYRIYLICKSATKVTNEAMKTYNHVSALYEEDIDENSKQQVIQFMEKIDSRTIQFSLCGLCKLDHECFVSNLVTIGGIFIIILQSCMTEIENWPNEVHSEWKD